VTARAAQWLRIGIGFGVSVLALWLVARRLNWSSLQAAISRAQLWPWIALAIAAYLGGQLLRGLRCRFLIRPWADISTLRAANIVAAGYASNNILPARLGELARAALLADQTGVTLPLSISIVIVERLLDAVAILLLLLAGVGMADTRTPLGQVSSRVGLITIGVLVALVIAALAPGVAHAGAMRVARLGRGRLRDGVLRWTSELASGIALLRDPRRVAAAVALSVAIWIAETGLFLFLLPALGLDMRVGVAFVVLGVTNLGILIPSTPGYVGTFHYFASRALMLFGVPEPLAFAYAIVVHVAFFVPVTIWGGAVIAWYGFLRFRSAALARQALVVSSADVDRGMTTVAVVADAPVDDRRFGALLESVVEAFIPWQRLRLEPAERARVIAETTRFVVGEIRALPVRLRLLFSIGLLGFRVTIRATTGRGFCDLALARRQRIVNAWAFGPFVPARQLFRVIRSTALLAFWETPGIRGAIDRSVPLR
jgi:glycosyltransferase 2 family protein